MRKQAAGIALLLALGATAPSATAAAERPPVVMITFDAFPRNSLLDVRGRIDAARYPTFARLAAGSTWYPNATTELDETGRALRSIFSGRASWRWARPNYANYPNNLFTLLGRRYHIEASEETSSFCPKRLCPNVRPQNGKSIERELISGRPERLASWIDLLRPGRRPTFYYKHVLLPHSPWVYLPSGHIYYDGPSEGGLPWQQWYSNPWLVLQNYQRHLLQLQFTDRLLGRVLDQLRAAGIYNRALIVVTADHGESLGRPGQSRQFDRRTIGDVALIPLFVKLPFQHARRIDRRHVRNLDLLPTIARVARLRPWWRLDGRSFLGPAARQIPRSILLLKRSGEQIRLSLGSLRRHAAASLRLKHRLFGGRRGLFGIGPHRELQGTSVARWPKLPVGALRAQLDEPGRFENVRLDGQFPPVKVTGRLAGPHSRDPHDLAIAINGTIEATAPAFAFHRSSSRLFSVLVPEESLREGANTVQLFSIEGNRRAPALRPLG
jgi:hypothetical protein